MYHTLFLNGETEEEDSNADKKIIGPAPPRRLQSSATEKNLIASYSDSTFEAKQFENYGSTIYETSSNGQTNYFTIIGNSADAPGTVSVQLMQTYANGVPEAPPSENEQADQDTSSTTETQNTDDTTTG